jgi:hypothetical protein
MPISAYNSIPAENKELFSTGRKYTRERFGTHPPPPRPLPPLKIQEWFKEIEYIQ